MIEIKNRWDGGLLYKSETATTIKAAALEAVVARADLSGAYLSSSRHLGSQPLDEPTSREPTSREPTSREPTSREPTSREPTSRRDVGSTIRMPDGSEIERAESCGFKQRLIYTVGEVTRPDSFNDDFRIECSNGIHFFITRKEAQEYNP